MCHELVPVLFDQWKNMSGKEVVFFNISFSVCLERVSFWFGFCSILKASSTTMLLCLAKFIEWKVFTLKLEIFTRDINIKSFKYFTNPKNHLNQFGVNVNKLQE